MQQEQQLKKVLSQAAVLHICTCYPRMLQKVVDTLEGDEKTGANDHS